MALLLGSKDKKAYKSDLVYVDYHSHVLPGIDDGAENLSMSVQMLEELNKQNVKFVVATSHFSNHREQVDSFLSRREEAYNLILPQIPQGMKILQGAEIRVERGLIENSDITKLCISGTNMILLEMPYEPLKSWITEEIENIGYRYKITPIIAHIDRYYKIYKHEDYEKLFSLGNVIFQINTEAYLSCSTKRFFTSIINGKLPVVFGSDCHNNTNRAPNMDKAMSYISRRMKAEDFEEMIKKTTKYINNQ